MHGAIFVWVGWRAVGWRRRRGGLQDAAGEAREAGRDGESGPFAPRLVLILRKW